MARLSTKDKEKPFILIGAVIAGIIIQKLIGKEISWLIYLTEIGVFFVIFAVMLLFTARALLYLKKEIRW
jgi:membrane protein CcdC involved in cytochrome C biogenesis